MLEQHTKNTSFDDLLHKKKNRFEEHLYTYFKSGNSTYQRNLHESMRYSLQAGGKRLRPLFLIESAALFGCSIEESLPFASAMEMIHTYSLIHDDLPAMDDDELRRGKPTCHVHFGEAQAILAGDALLNSAHTIMLRASLESTKVENAVRASVEISSKAGEDGMIVGQIADIANENSEMDLETLNYINVNKTGALIEASFVAGAMLGGASDNEIGKMRTIAHNIGLSFQIIDDILDIEGDTAIIGKPAGSDAKNAKTTYPSLIGLENSREKARTLTLESLELLESMPYNTDFLRTLIEKLLSRKL